MLVISFIVLVIMLFVGMVIMITPTKIAAMLSRQSNSAWLDTFMTFASILFLTGLVGIAVIGFLISKDQTANKVNT
jgi:hypothetical protein